MKKYVLTVVDTGYTENDFTPHVLGVYDSEEEAHSAFIDNMEGLIDAAVDDVDNIVDMDIDEADYEKRVLVIDGGRYGATWNIEEVEF